MVDDDKELLQKIENTRILIARIESAQRHRLIKMWWKNLWEKCKSIFRRA